VKITGDPVAMTDQATLDIGGLHTTYRIAATTKRRLDPTATVTVEVNGGAAPAHTVNRLAGEAVFDVALDPADVVTITGSYLPVADLADAKEFTLTASATNADASTFQSGDYMVRRQTQLDVGISLGRFANLDEEMTDRLLLGETVVVEVDFDGSGSSAFAWCVIDSDEHSGGAADLIEEGIELVGTPDADGRVIHFV
jgi:hypothetical protein